MFYTGCPAWCNPPSYLSDLGNSNKGMCSFLRPHWLEKARDFDMWAEGREDWATNSWMEGRWPALTLEPQLPQNCSVTECKYFIMFPVTSLLPAVSRTAAGRAVPQFFLLGSYFQISAQWTQKHLHNSKQTKVMPSSFKNNHDSKSTQWSLSKQHRTQ